MVGNSPLKVDKDKDINCFSNEGLE